MGVYTKITVCQTAANISLAKFGDETRYSKLGESYIARLSVPASDISHAERMPLEELFLDTPDGLQGFLVAFLQQGHFLFL